jgi:DNA-binding protein HU-beta
MTQTRHRGWISTVDFRPYPALNSATGSLTWGFFPIATFEDTKDLPGETMNKADLVDRIAAGSDISKAQAAIAIDTAMQSITGALKKGDRVALIGFGTFSVAQRKARNGRNPQTGATIKIAARRVAKFTPGAELRKAVNRAK